MSAWYNTSPQTIHLLPLHLSMKMLIDLIDRAISIRKIVIVVKDIQHGDINTSQRVYTPNEEGVLVYLSLSRLVELRTR